MKKLPAKMLIALIRAYQVCIAPLLPPMCRFTPSCSAYTLEAIRRFGLIKGMALGIWRICRCQPFNPGGYDPVPEKPVEQLKEEQTSPKEPVQQHHG